jgi:hypothetical protein
MPRFQTRKIKFPELIYVSFIWFKVKGDKDLKKFPVALDKVYPSQTELIKETEKLINRPDMAKSVLKDHIVMVKLKYVKDVPLKKEYWEESKSVEDYSLPEKRNTFFINAFLQKNNYKFLIVPQGKNKKKEDLFALGFAFAKPTRKNLDTFMKGSDMFVDSAAKNSALYSVIELYGYDFTNGQKIKDGVGYWEN